VVSVGDGKDRILIFSEHENNFRIVRLSE